MPHLESLDALLNNALSTLDPRDYPVMKWQLQTTGNRAHHGLGTRWWETTPMFEGGLSAVEQSMVLRWIREKVRSARDKGRRTDAGFGSQISIHALTILISFREQEAYKKLPGCPPLSNDLELRRFILGKAWDDLVGRSSITSTELRPDDVDADAISLLEARMFSSSKTAGIAGYEQWGLDAGDHQDHWDPYQNRTSRDDDDDGGSFSDSALEVGFICLRMLPSLSHHTL
jgi:hypothetical protein